MNKSGKNVKLFEFAEPKFCFRFNWSKTKIKTRDWLNSKMVHSDWFPLVQDEIEPMTREMLV